MSDEKQPLRPESVEVGMGVTYRVGSDRYAGTITSKSASGKTIHFTDDNYKAAPGSGGIYGQQEYVYESVPEIESVNPLGETTSNVKTARWSEKHGCYMYFGRGLSRGRHAYYDPHF